MRILRPLFLAAFLCVPVASAEASPWRLQMQGVLPMHVGDPVTITTLDWGATFIYDNPLNRPFDSSLAGPDPVTVLFASVSFNDRVVFSQSRPDIWFLLDAGLAGAHWQLPTQYLPPELTGFFFTDTGAAWMWFDGFGEAFNVEYCHPWPQSFCTYTLTQLPESVPEPATLFYALAAVCPGLVAWRRRRRNLHSTITSAGRQ